MQQTKRPLIGIVSSPLYETTNIGINYNYVEYFSKFGDVVLILASSNRVVDLDLLVLPGGADVNPSRYGEIPNNKTQRPNIFAEHFGVKVLPKYIDNGTPIFGICRGMQELGVTFGAKLHQHLDIPSNIKTDRSKTIEFIQINDNEFNRDLLKGTDFSKFFDVRKKNDTLNKVTKKKAYTQARYKAINSIHHQAIDMNSIEGTNIQVIGTSRTHRNIEAIKIKDKNIFGVQYHPECMKNPALADCLIKKLLKC